MAGIPARAINLGLQMAAIKAVFLRRREPCAAASSSARFPCNPSPSAGATRRGSPTGTGAGRA